MRPRPFFLGESAMARLAFQMDSRRWTGLPGQTNKFWGPGVSSVLSGAMRTYMGLPRVIRRLVAALSMQEDIKPSPSARRHKGLLILILPLAVDSPFSRQTRRNRLARWLPICRQRHGHGPRVRCQPPHGSSSRKNTKFQGPKGGVNPSSAPSNSIPLSRYYSC